MTKQLDLFGILGDSFGPISEPEYFNPKTGPELRDTGIKKAVEHADKVVESWSHMAYEHLKKYIVLHDEFMAEDLRYDSKLPEPPSKRAWGGIMVRAAKSGLIYRVGFRAVKNPKAHCANASLWRVAKKY